MDSLYRRTEVLEMLRVARATLWRMERNGMFPRAVKISEGRVGYLKSEADRWFAERGERR